MRKRVFAVIATLIAVVSLAGCNKPNSTANDATYRNPDVLAQSIKDTANARVGIINPMVSVFCIHDTGNYYFCNGADSIGETWTVTAIVSDDGNSWITGNN